MKIALQEITEEEGIIKLKIKRMVLEIFHNYFSLTGVSMKIIFTQYLIVSRVPRVPCRVPRVGYRGKSKKFQRTPACETQERF